MTTVSLDPKEAARRIVRDAIAGPELAAMRNDIDQAQAVADRWRAALLRYGHHDPVCHVDNRNVTYCRCGLDTFLAETDTKGIR